MSSWEKHQNGEPLVGVRVDRRQAREIRRANPDVSLERSLELATTEHSVSLTRLPSLAHLSAEEYRHTILQAVERRVGLAAPMTDESAFTAQNAPDMPCLEEIEVRTLYSPHGERLKIEVPAGMDTVRDWPATYILSEVERRRPLYITRRTKLRTRFDEERWQRNLEYAWASKTLRHDLGKPKFPRGMIPPHKTGPIGSTRPPPLENRGLHLKLSA